MTFRLSLIYGLFSWFLLSSCSKYADDGIDFMNEVVEDTTYTPKERPDIMITLADPTIFYDDITDLYYLYGTSGSEVVHKGFKVFTSNDLTTWTDHKTLALSKNDVYGTDDFWAPQVFKYEEVYYMAYTANQHIAIASSDNPLGPFKQTNQIPISDPDGVGTIDPYVLISQNDGKKYLYYVRFTGGNRLYSAELNEDLTDVVTSTIRPAISTEDQPQGWEHAQANISVAEGPTVIEHKGEYYFLYSANHFESEKYAVGYATSDGPMGPWTKYEDNPVLSKTLIGRNGTGHGDLFQDKTGQYYYVFHTHFSNLQIQPRLTGLIKVNFVSDQSGKDVLEFDKDSFKYLVAK